MSSSHFDDFCYDDEVPSAMLHKNIICKDEFQFSNFCLMTPSFGAGKIFLLQLPVIVI